MLQVWNELQQDFNSKTCENCKFTGKSINEDYCECSIINANDNMTLGGSPLTVKKDFGCNKWSKNEN